MGASIGGGQTNVVRENSRRKESYLFFWWVGGLLFMWGKSRALGVKEGGKYKEEIAPAKGKNRRHHGRPSCTVGGPRRIHFCGIIARLPQGKVTYRRGGLGNKKVV